MNARHASKIVAPFAILLAFGCATEVGRPPVSGGSSGGGLDDDGGGGAAGRWPFAEASGDTRLTRLTHEQYEHTVDDLFGVPDLLEISFPPDALNGFDFDTTVGLEVDGRLGPLYRTAAEQLAATAVADPTVFGNIVPCSESDPGCATTFVETFGARAFRRPLTAEQSTKFRALFDQGASLIGSGDTFRDGVELTLRAMLQSPQFLYRVETQGEPGDDGRILLDDWEVASRLSYFLQDSMPDEALFAMARDGRLGDPQEVAEVVERLVASPRGIDKLVSFHAQNWEFERFSSIGPDRATYPATPDDLIARVREASERFVAEIIDEGGGLEEFLLADYAFVDDGLAALYGLPSPGPTPTRVDIGGLGRRGFLTQVGFLASNAYAVETDPIHRGLFVVRDLLCRTIPDPPPGASTTELPETDEPLLTTRDEVSLLTGGIACAGCHNQINPPGFAFEGFDAVGQIRTTQNGVAVDTTGTWVLDGESRTFAGPLDMIDMLATSREARECYTGRFLEFAYGRRLTTADAPTWAALAQEPSSVTDLVTQLATSEAFLSLDATGVMP